MMLQHADKHDSFAYSLGIQYCFWTSRINNLDNQVILQYKSLIVCVYELVENCEMLVSAVVLGALAAATAASAYEQVFFDDFEGTDINADYWTVNNNTKHCSPCELSLYLERNVEVTGGNLVITTLREAVVGGPEDEQFNYTSGWILGNKEWMYGLFEVRAKLPAQSATGAWPAHWLMPRSDQCWPTGGEIDIMESTSNPFDYHVFGSYRWSAECSVDEQVLPGAAYPPLGEPVPDWSADFHIFAVEWTASALVFSVDGIAYETKTAEEVIMPTAPMYYILDTAVAWYMPPGPNAVYPATHVIDWVRVSQ
jgi:beta-glucanase (GH16 family)